MNNIDFLEKILTTNYEYWIVSKKEIWSTGKADFSVWFISVPYIINRGIKREDVKLIELRDLQGMEVPNISLSEDYPPFQYGITFYNLWIGFPLLSGSPKEFLKKALEIKSKDIFVYKENLKEFLELNNQPDAIINREMTKDS